MVSEKNTKNEILEAYQSLSRKAAAQKLEIPQRACGLNARSTKGELLEGAVILDRLLEKAATAAVKQKEASPVKETKESPMTAAPKMEEVKPAVTQKEMVSYDKEEDELKLLNKAIIDKVHSLKETEAALEKESAGLDALSGELQAFVIMVNEYRQRFMTDREAHEAALDDKEAEIREKDIALTEELRNRLLAAEEKLENVKNGIEEKKKNRDIARQSETEQYNYDLSVKQRREDDVWTDEASKKELLLKSLDTEIKALQEQLETEEKLVPQLEEKLSRLPVMIENARTEGAAAREKELIEQYAHETALAKKDEEAAVSSLERRIRSLSEDYEALLSEKTALQQKLDKAYEESNKLYIQTIQSTGGVKILGRTEK